ncbi:MAG: Alpha-D-glucose 1-phosphate phosphatase YihX [Chlamydiae bacterium]|nr:Alpha-D-glucose 1-phosphate phosphatase YihX [Chlamydiota bacterium]
MRALVFFLLFTISAFAKEVIVFDFGGVVGKVNRKPVLQRMSHALDIPYAQVKKALAGDHFYEALEQGQSYWQQFAASHGRPLPQSWMTDLDSYRAHVVTRVPGTAEVIHKLKADGYQVALLSNTKQDRANFLRAQGYYAPFDPVLVSCEMGTKKPLAPAFKQLINRLDTQPDNIIFIDNKRTNVHAAKRAGIQAIHFTSAETLQHALTQKKILSPPSNSP